jgi:hypothetical protein
MYLKVSSTFYRFNLAANGLLSSVPYILQWLLTFFTGWVSDIIRAKNLLRTITVRKINTTLGHLVSQITNWGASSQAFQKYI